jgi:hypothetical protein
VSEEPARAGCCRQDLHSATSQKMAFFIVTAVKTYILLHFFIATHVCATQKLIQMCEHVKNHLELRSECREDGKKWPRQSQQVARVLAVFYFLDDPRTYILTHEILNTLNSKNDEKYGALDCNTA